MAIEHVTGAMCKWMIISQNKAFRFGAQLADSFQNIASRILFCPETEFFGFRTKRGGLRSPIDIPHLLGNLIENLFQVFAALADFDEGVQKAFDENDHRK